MGLLLVVCVVGAVIRFRPTTGDSGTPYRGERPQPQGQHVVVYEVTLRALTEDATPDRFGCRLVVGTETVTGEGSPPHHLT